MHIARRGTSDFGVVSLFTLRAGVTGHGGGFAGELVAGPGTSFGTGTAVDNIVGIGGGLYYSLQQVEFGYSFRFFVGGSERPSWLGAHFFGIRVYSPFRSSKR